MASAPNENEQAAPGAAVPQGVGLEPTSAEAKLANKKDTSLKEFLSKMDDYAPIVSQLPFIPFVVPFSLSSLLPFHFPTFFSSSANE
jgi:hypothetical protein